MRRRVVVTGVGLLSSVGSGTEESWSAIQSGKNGIGRITQFDAERVRVAHCRRSEELSIHWLTLIKKT